MSGIIEVTGEVTRVRLEDIGEAVRAVSGVAHLSTGSCVRTSLKPLARRKDNVPSWYGIVPNVIGAKFGVLGKECPRSERHTTLRYTLLYHNRDDTSRMDRVRTGKRLLLRADVRHARGSTVE